MSFADIRKEYAMRGLSEADLAPDPFQQFQSWFAEAAAAGGAEPNAMTLATATPDGQPSARMVLLKGVDERGFTFYTNYESRKGAELEANPRAALIFYWALVERQVRVEGAVERVGADESDSYFHSRPLGSQIGAWASHQDDIIPARDVLEQRVAELTAQYNGRDVPRPSYWGGYRVLPCMVEFWQGRPSRLHDRLRYSLREDGSWAVERLSP